jgi:cytochrome c-type biogenesis protein CcmH/NrfG
MTNGSKSSGKATGWTPTQAYTMAVVCLLIGIAVGYLVRGSSTPDKAAANSAAQMPSAFSPGGTGQITPEQLKRMADKQVEPMVARLKSEPNNAELLASIGNVFYDAQLYNNAIAYYDRSLQIQPGETNVRTDMGTAYWYMGNADRAIAEFQTVLKAEPTKASTLMNLGVVQWQGKMDAKAATATWQKLLATNPNYENKDKVEQLLSQVRQHLSVKPGTKTDKPAL